MKYIKLNLIFGLLFSWMISLAQEEPTIATRHHSEFQTPNFLPQSVAYDQLGRPYLYVASKAGGLNIFDVSDLNNMELQGRFAINNFLKLQVMDVVQDGNFLYLALGNIFGGKQTPGLGIIDVTDPQKPTVVSVWVHDRRARGAAMVRIQGDYAYLGAMSEGVLILNIKDKRKVALVSKYVPDIHFPKKDPNRMQRPQARGMAFKGNHLFLCYDTGGLRVIDISTPSQPKEVGRYLNTTKNIRRQLAYHTLVLNDSLAYVGADHCGMEVLNISDPQNIRQVGWWNPWNCHSPANDWTNSHGHINQTHFDAERNLVFMSAGDSELQIVDVANPMEPKTAGTFGFPTDNLGAWGLTVHEHYVFLTYIKNLNVPFNGVWSGIKVVEWSPK
ncbi:MAG: LVIVD repeat-containing protein [Flammeovirgaceae bacterium]